MATITGRTDRQTDRQSATQYAAPPREEGRIKITTRCSNFLQRVVDITTTRCRKLLRVDIYIFGYALQ